MFLSIIASTVPVPSKAATDAAKDFITGMTKTEAMSMFVLFLVAAGVVTYLLGVYLKLKLAPLTSLKEDIDEMKQEQKESSEEIKKQQAELMKKVKSGNELELMQKNAVLEHERNCMGNGMTQLAGSIDRMVAAFLESEQNKKNK